MKNYIFYLLFIGFLFNSIDATSQTNNTVSEKKVLEKPYNPNDNAQQKIDALENKNEAVFKKYAPNGDKLGYPFFVVLNSSGKVLKVQESGSLEEGKGYNEAKVLNFLKSVKP